MCTGAYVFAYILELFYIISLYFYVLYIHMHICVHTMCVHTYVRTCRNDIDIVLLWQEGSQYIRYICMGSVFLGWLLCITPVVLGDPSLSDWFRFSMLWDRKLVRDKLHIYNLKFMWIWHTLILTDKMVFSHSCFCGNWPSETALQREIPVPHGPMFELGFVCRSSVHTYVRLYTYRANVIRGTSDNNRTDFVHESLWSLFQLVSSVCTRICM